MTHHFTARLFRLLTIAIILGFFPNSIGSAQNPSNPSFARKEKGPNKPIQIESMIVSPDPGIGQQSTLTVEFITTRDEPRAILDIRLPQGIEILSGDLHWEGTAAAGE